MNSSNQGHSATGAGEGTGTLAQNGQDTSQSHVHEAQGSLSPYPLQQTETYSSTQSPYFEAQGSLSPYPIQHQNSGTVSPATNVPDNTYQHQQGYGNQYAQSPHPSEPTWPPVPLSSTLDSDAPAHPDLSNRPAGMTAREAAERREQEILKGPSGTWTPTPGHGPSDAPAHPDLSNRPVGMTAREAAERREQEILRGAVRPNQIAPENVPSGHVVPLMALRDKAMPVDCPGCQRMIVTRVDKHVSERGTMWSVVICLCLGVLCFWIPLVMDEFKETEHRCPHCGVVLAAVDSGGTVTHIYHVPRPPQPSAFVQPQYQQQPPQYQQQQQGQAQSPPMEMRTHASVHQPSAEPREMPADASAEISKSDAQVHEMDAGPVKKGSQKSNKKK